MRTMVKMGAMVKIIPMVEIGKMAEDRTRVKFKATARYIITLNCKSFDYDRKHSSGVKKWHNEQILASYSKTNWYRYRIIF